MAHLVLPFTLLLLVPPSADAYSRGAGSCHTASGGHGEATPGDGGFALSLASAATPGSTLTLQLAHTLPETQFKGFLVKVTGPGGGYDDGGASFTGLDAHALAQPKECYGPSTATHRSSDLKDAVELELALPAEPVELIATVIVMISRQSSMDSEWYTWTVPISVAEQAVEPPPAPVRCRPDGSRCPLILSLQPQDEWDTGHVSCANRILDDDVGFDDPALGAAVLELAGGDTTTPIVTYCYSGNEFVFGMFVEPELTVAGFTDVTNGGAFVEPSEAVDWNNDEVLEELCVCDSPCGSPAAAAAAACPSDVTGDGMVDVNDLLQLLSAFGGTSPPGTEDEDVTGDGAVDVNDLLQLLSEFGRTDCAAAAAAAGGDAAAAAAPCAMGDDCGGQVWNDCGSSCPAVCGTPAPMMCNMMCNAAFQCGAAGQCFNEAIGACETGAGR